jgi:putative mRNA 3-end processing factor
MNEMLTTTDVGLYCAPGDFYIDPWRPVQRAIVTHAHSDHARWGCRHYLGARPSEHLLRMRLGAEADIATLPYGQQIQHGAAKVSFHPAGHMLGSAQIRVEVAGRVAVVTGDYKLGSDPTCESWEPIRCDLMVTESTFGLPVYRWPDQEIVFDQINRWWRQNAAAGICTIIYGYAIGKSQRILAGLDRTIGPIYTHGAVEKGVDAYRRSGVPMPPTTPVSETDSSTDFRGAIVVAVPSAHGTPWMRRFGNVSTAMASGWMMIRGMRRRRAVDRGFILSDHVDWPSLISAVDRCDPKEVWITHGSSAVVARFLRDRGYDARSIDTRFGEEEEDLGETGGDPTGADAGDSSKPTQTGPHQTEPSQNDHDTDAGSP